MASGPSKQELEMYWESSRQYFDELAEHYRKNDPAYYKEYIQPFYSNPFRTGASGSASGKKSGCGPKAVLAVSLMLVIAGLAAAVFLLMVGSDDRTIDKKKDSQYNRDTITGIEPPPAPDKIEPQEEVNPETSIHYRRGVKLFEQKEYRLAGRYLRNVPKNDPNYEDAQRLLKIIETIEKKDNRKKPIERTR